MDKEWIRPLAGFIFVQHEPVPADVIFIAGNAHAEPSERAAALFSAGFAPYILPSGRYSVKTGYFPGQRSGKRRYPGEFMTEWEFMRTVLIANGVPESAILQEDRATFTWQNAIASRAVLEASGLCIRRAILCCMPVHARRSLLYYSSVFPEAEFFVCPAEDCEITQENWAESAEGIDAVLSEVERCGAQFHEIAKQKLLHPASFPSPLERNFAPAGVLDREAEAKRKSG
ncbi:MAG: YdcF family protein [Clostridiales bacterium]|nr:YdcF family protein [Clostridiales bacterium]